MISLRLDYSLMVVLILLMMLCLMAGFICFKTSICCKAYYCNHFGIVTFYELGWISLSNQLNDCKVAVLEGLRFGSFFWDGIV